jgi:hypothetical protein
MAKMGFKKLPYSTSNHHALDPQEANERAQQQQIWCPGLQSLLVLGEICGGKVQIFISGISKNWHDMVLPL